MPKCKTEFHRSQALQLESFFLLPDTEAQKKSNCMCPIRALQAYVYKTNDLRKSQQLFVSYKLDLKSARHKETQFVMDSRGYTLQKLDSPKNVRAYGTRAQASSWAAFSGVDPARICRAAVRSNLHNFCKHYRTHQLLEGPHLYGGTIRGFQ